MSAKKLFSLFLCLFIGVSSSLMIVNAEEEIAVRRAKETQDEDEGELDVTEPLYDVTIFTSKDTTGWLYVDQNEQVDSVPGMSWDAENHVLSITDVEQPVWQIAFGCDGYAGEPVKMNIEGENVFCAVESEIPLEIIGSGTLSTGFVTASAFTMRGGTLNLKGELLKEYFLYYTEEEDIGTGPAICAMDQGETSFEKKFVFDNCTVNITGIYQGGIYHYCGNIDIINSSINIRIPKYGVLGLVSDYDMDDPEMKGGRLSILDSSVSILLLRGDTALLYCHNYVDVNGNLNYYAGVNTGQKGLSYYDAFERYTYDSYPDEVFRSGKDQNYFMITDRFMFNDVSDPSRYFFDPVYWAYADGITVGTSPVMFSPDQNVTRGQMVTFLYRVADEPEITSEKLFDDVVPYRYYAEPISWAASEGITTGYAGTNNFGPDDNCTREQIVTFLWRYAGSPKPVNQASFTDAKEGAYYLDALSWAAENGITVGLNDGTGRFGVGQTCTRGMCVTFLQRYASLKTMAESYQ